VRLTRYTDYSLRVLIYLALQNERLATIDEIARRYAISRNHVMKVVYELGQLGYLETVRGKKGGVRLNCEARQILIGDVVRHTETDMHLVECFGTDNQCRLTSGCVLKGVLGEALSAFFEVLDGYTLADLIGPKKQLRELLLDDAFA